MLSVVVDAVRRSVVSGLLTVPDEHHHFGAGHAQTLPADRPLSRGLDRHDGVGRVGLEPTTTRL